MDVTTGLFSRETLRPTEGSTQAEQFSLWAFRLWWSAFPELQLAWGDFLHGFRVCGVLPAAESCHRFCSIVLATAGGGSGVACLNCPYILPTEDQLLSALVVAGSADVSNVERALRKLIPPTAARVAAPLAVRYTQALADAGFKWPTPPIFVDRSGAHSVNRLH